MFNCKCENDECKHKWNVSTLPRPDHPGYITGLTCPSCGGREILVRGADEASTREFNNMALQAVLGSVLEAARSGQGRRVRGITMARTQTPADPVDNAHVGQCDKCGDFAKLYKLVSNDAEKMVCNKCL